MQSNVPEKELILKDIYVASIENDHTLSGFLDAIFNNNTYRIGFNYDMEYGAEIDTVFLEGKGQSKNQYCGPKIPAGPYSPILDAYITDYINNFISNSSNEVHIYIKEEDLAKPR